jgi:hypothetical protein
VKYAETDTDVRVGDRVTYRRLLFGTTEGMMVYVPGVSALNGELEYDNIEHCVVRLKSGRHIAIANAVGDQQLSRRINFLARGDVGKDEIGPDMPI